jgi:uncharacterized repeat protein (TIGR01451 family)
MHTRSLQIFIAFYELVRKLMLVLALLILPWPALAQLCAVPGFSGPVASLSGVVNTYYTGSSGGASGSTVNLGAQRGAPSATTTFSVGDLVLIMQMQGATLNTSDTSLYGDGQGASNTRQDATVPTLPAPSPTVPYSAATNATNGYAGGFTAATAGRYEYAVVTQIASATQLRVRGAGAGGNLLYSYTQSAGPNQNTYQVIRVPQHASAVITGALTAPVWNGSTGGVVALDVAGLLTFNAGINVSQSGFRGGGVRNIGALTSPQFGGWRALYATNLGGMKGEGLAGTPARVYDSLSNALSTLAATDGYVDGDVGRGAPGNAGGGGNQHNAGGGGGGNGGAGGNGGGSWNANVNNQSGWQTGGFGGFPVSASFDSNRLFMGGGGGAGDVGGNGSTDPQGSGANGGGIIIVRAGSISGSASLLSNGGNAPNTGSTDSAGGGGAGGSILISVQSGGLAGLTLQANGGNGGNTTMGATNPEQDGPGGGGGGGVIYTPAGGAGTSGVGAAGNLTTANTNPTDPPFYYARPGQTGLLPSVGLAQDNVGARAGFECLPVLSVNKSATPTVINTPIGATTSYTISVTNGTLSGGVTNLTLFDQALPPGWTLASPATYTYSPLPSPTVLGAGAEAAAGVVEPVLPDSSINSLATSFDLRGPATAPGEAATAGQNALRWGTFFLDQGATLTLSFVVNIADTSPVGNYHNSAGLSYLDPTRLNADTNRLITPATSNGANRSLTNYTSNTTHASAAAGAVNGSNYNGLQAGPTGEDVRLNGDLSISKTGLLSAAAGQTFTYTLSPRNNGRAIRDLVFSTDQASTAFNTDTISRILSNATVSVTDTLPASLTLTSAFSGAGWSCSNAGQTVSCTRTPTSVPLAASTTLPIITGTVRVSTTACPGPIVNTATIAGLQAPYIDYALANNTTSFSTSIDCNANLSVTKTNAVTTLTAGTTTSYTLTFANAGPSTADGAVAKDIPSTGLSNCSVTSCTASGGSPAAVCPAPAAWPNLLTGAGLILINFPSGSTLTFALSCAVSATGQ